LKARRDDLTAADEKSLGRLCTALLKDQRLHPYHLAIYFALLHVWQEQNCVIPFRISRAEIMKASKIRAFTTYHKHMKDLDEFGFIQYEPSFHPLQGSSVTLLIQSS
jgi:hypothetical protein